MEITTQLIEELFDAMREGREVEVPRNLNPFYRRFKNAPEALDEAAETVKPVLAMPFFGPHYAAALLKSFRLSKERLKHPRSLYSSSEFYEGAVPSVKELPSHSDFPGMNLGSVQLLRTLAAKGTTVEDVIDTIRHLEGVCEGEPMIGMELYPEGQDFKELIKVSAGAASLNFLRGEYNKKSTVIPEWLYDSGYISSLHGDIKWNYRLMPTCHPLFATLMNELGPYIPETLMSYMLCIGTNMQSDATLLLSAWILSHPEISMLAAATDRYEGDVEFPGIYLGRRIEKAFRKNIRDMPPRSRKSSKQGTYWRTGDYLTQTNLYAGAMHCELPQPQDFIRMAGVLAKAYENKPEYFGGFRDAFYDTLRAAGVNEGVVPNVEARRLDADRNGRSFPELAETARGLPIDVSDYIWERVQQSVAGIERAMYKPEELALISKAYAGRLFEP